MTDQTLSGGFIGYNCNHVYPHTTHSKLNFLAPDNLKGADMLLYEIFKSLGLEVSFRPVARNIYENYSQGDPLPLIGLSLGLEKWDMVDDEYLEQTFDEWAGRADPPGDSDGANDGQKWSESYVDFLAVHWLNDFGHNEPQINWIAVSVLGDP